MSVGQEVTRLEIAEAIGGVFGVGTATRDEIIEIARSTGRPEVGDVLMGLPDRRYSRLNELWEDLHDIPVGV